MFITRRRRSLTLRYSFRPAWWFAPDEQIEILPGEHPTHRPPILLEVITNDGDHPIVRVRGPKSGRVIRARELRNLWPRVARELSEGTLVVGHDAARWRVAEKSADKNGGLVLRLTSLAEPSLPR